MLLKSLTNGSNPSHIRGSTAERLSWSRPAVNEGGGFYAVVLFGLTSCDFADFVA